MPKSTRSWLLAILLLSVLLRVGVAVYLGDDLSDWRGGTADQVSYDALAQRVTTGHATRMSASVLTSEGAF